LKWAVAFKGGGQKGREMRIRMRRRLTDAFGPAICLKDTENPQYGTQGCKYQGEQLETL
jgi:hypothetical protein